jgi:hypothetical protein
VAVGDDRERPPSRRDQSGAATSLGKQGFISYKSAELLRPIIASDATRQRAHAYTVSPC